jgi:hypothetical protein
MPWVGLTHRWTRQVDHDALATLERGGTAGSVPNNSGILCVVVEVIWAQKVLRGHSDF